MPGSQLHEPEARRATTIHPWRQAVPHHGREPRSDPQSKGREQIASLDDQPFQARRADEPEIPEVAGLQDQLLELRRRRQIHHERERLCRGGAGDVARHEAQEHEFPARLHEVVEVGSREDGLDPRRDLDGEPRQGGEQQPVAAAALRQAVLDVEGRDAARRQERPDGVRVREYVRGLLGGRGA
jgi:hypothetical protein